MKIWRNELQTPAQVADPAVRDAWFCRMAERLLNGCRLMAAAEPCRIAEVEIYRRGEDHPDPFAHAEPVQLKCGRWYFHMTHGHYRGGSYKGLDLTFGDGRAFGGILIRSIERADGTFINGPSLCVDYFLKAAGVNRVAELDAAIGPLIWNPRSPIYLQALRKLDSRSIYRSPRVGLSLKRVAPVAENLRFLLRFDRFLTEPRRIRKGKLHLALALLMAGKKDDEIVTLTGSPRGAIARLRSAMTAVVTDTHVTALAGLPLTPRILGRIASHLSSV